MKQQINEKELFSKFSMSKNPSKNIPATAFHYRNGQNKTSTLLKAVKIINDRNSKFSNSNFSNSLQILQSKSHQSQNRSSTISFKDFVKPKKFQIPDFDCLICYGTYPVNEGFKCSPIFHTVTEMQQHLICVSCLKSYCHIACFEGLLGYGGLGLKCVEPECKNVILLSEFEKHINEEDYLLLQNRLQEQCIIDAGLADLVTCSECGLKSCVDILLTFFTCNCGRRQCRNCHRVFDDNHEERTCREMDLEEAAANSLNTNVKYYNSKMPSMQCAICREPNINYNHFCNCNLNELGHGKCEECGKSCRNTEIPEELDEIALLEIQDQFNQ